MIKTYLYIPEPLGAKITNTAKIRNKSKAEIMRLALNTGLVAMEKQGGGGAEALLKLAEIGKKYKMKGPHDGSINLDYYLWGLPKKNPRIKS